MSSSGLTCTLCTRPITSASNVRSCNSCRKFIHSDCDSDLLIANTVETEYVCPTCRNSPLVADAMMTSAGNSSVAASPTSISTHDEASRGVPLDHPYGMDSPSNRNSPLMSLAQLDASFNEIFNIAQPTTGQVPSMSPSGSTSFPEFSATGDITDELRFTGRRERSDNSCTFSRTSRGSGVKKPYGRGMTPRTRSLGVVGDFAELTHSHRGKRGGRGGNKNGRGRRPRGGKTSAMLAMVNAAAAVRDADQESSETDDTRHRMEENDYIRTVVVTCAENSYFLQMPVCLICGSIGKDIEGTMVICVTCSQSFHTYCVGLHDKLSATIVKRGWRCLDCTVCEGCGDGHDESNLILCDECDVSYHIYCLEPPLERIPHGPWRCKWCAACRRCGKQTSNTTDIQHLDGFCETCFTLRRCPKCMRPYDIGDNIIKCHSCARWLHGKCEELYGEEMFETASENGFRCSLCRPQGNAASDAFNILLCDNVTLNKCALEVLHSRYGGTLFRHPSSGDSLYEFPLYSFAPRSHSFEEPMEEDEVESPGFGLSMGVSGRGRGMRSGGPGRRVLKLGIGGFFVKVPRHRLSNAEEENGVEEDSAKPKIKRPRKPRRSQLEDNYPPVIQESFFGMRPVEGRCLLDVVVDEPNLVDHQKTTLISDKQKEACEMNEMDSEALRDGESLLGNITENDILGNMEEIDLENLDLNELLLDGDEDDDDDEILESTLSDKMGPSSEDSQMTVSPHGGLARSQASYQGQQVRRFTATAAGGTSQSGVRQNIYMNQTSIHGQSSSRSSSQLGDACVERVNQATEKWEEDEPLGERATKAAVLYANINYPQWKEQYPEWSERVKHIHRMWRSLDANSRQQYVNKARENRANRVKQPRAKRVSAATPIPTGVVRAVVGANRYGMQPGHDGVGGYCRSEADSSAYNERFKVPTMPYGGECIPAQNRSDATSGSSDVSVVQPFGVYHSEQEGGSFAVASHAGTAFVRNPQSAVAHLSKEILDNYSLLQKRSSELAKYQLAIESDLARMRKQKKNLTAKRRQLNKNNQQYDAHGKRIEIELSEADKYSLSTLISAIPIRQKDLENCKRDIKLHSSNVRDFEVKNSIPPELIPHLEPDVQQIGLHSNVVRAKQQQGGALSVPSGMMSSNSGIQPPPSYQTYGLVGNCRAPYQPGTNQMFDYSHSGYSLTTKTESEAAQMGSGSPTPSSGRPGSSSSTEWQYRGGRGKRKRRDDDRSEDCKRPSVLGDIAENVIAQFERDIYDVVDHLITQAVIMVDGAEAARKSGMLKRLLESQPGKVFASQRSSFSGLEFSNPPKPKKKRTQQKKLGAGSSNEYELLLERISTQLRLCQPLPRSAIEPISRIGRSSYAIFGVTDLPDRIDKPSIEGNKIGEVRLVFMGDYYTRMFDCPIDEASLYYTMSDFSADVKLPILYRTRGVVPRQLQEREKPVSKLRALSVVRRSGSPPLRQISRIPEAVAPEAPPRYAFFKKREMPKKVEVSIVFEGPEGSLDAEAGLRQLMVLLGMDQLPDYEFDTPPQTPEPSKRDSSEIQKAEPRATDDFTCRHCGALTDQPAVRQTAHQLGIADHEPKDETLAFCSMCCYYNYMANAKAVLSPEDLSRAERFVDTETLAKLRQASAENFARCLHLGKGQMDSPGSSNICSPLSDGRAEPEVKNNVQIIQARELSLMGDPSVQGAAEKKWKGHLWMQYDAALDASFQRLSSPVRQKQLAAELRDVLRVHGMDLAEDKRQCALCGQCGDGETDSCGRLLNADANTWVHVNCALWSEEVYETSAGALINVEDTLRRSVTVICSVCHLMGASLRCYKLNCDKHFHVVCAKSTKGKFMKDKTFVCEEHDDYRNDLVLDRLEALRRIYIDREENQLIAKLFHSEADRLVLRVGSLIFSHIGQLLPEQLKAFHNSDHIFPIGYSVKRVYWSPSNATERIQYQCAICDKASAPEFVISYEGGQEIREASASAAWNQILTEVEKTRDKANGLLRLFPANLTGESLFGLTEAAVSKMTESLPGVDQLITYTFKHGGSPLMDLPLAVNPSGCARCEPRFRTLIKHRRRNQPAAASARPSVGADGLSRETRTRGSSTSLVSTAELTAIRGLYGTTLDCYGGRWEPGQLGTAYYSQYQKMKKEWKNTVYLARSRIQGLGLYASRDIEMNSMIIEYKGEVIRSEVGEMREKKYEAQNRGVYMFRIDDERLIDATMAGGPARYINHSCDPNCSTRLVDSGPSGDDKKIIIIANRPISAGEELTYDYQFDIEDAADKIPCLCGAPNCQKWMN